MLSNKQTLSYSFLALIPFLFLAVIGSLDEQLLLQLDRPVSLAVSQLREPVLNEWIKALTHCAGGLVVGSATLVMMLVLYLKGYKKLAGWYGVLMLFGCLVMMSLFKHIFQRPRPEMIPSLINPGSYSFPSGHAMNSTLLYGSLAGFASWKFSNKKWQILSILLAVVKMILIGFSRIYLGVHYLTDIIAGYSLASSYLIIIFSFLQQKFYTEANLKEE